MYSQNWQVEWVGVNGAAAIPCDRPLKWQQSATNCATGPTIYWPNGEADQRRTIDSASPLDFARRLIQRLVPGHVVAWSLHRHPTTE
jgi:hypothetical protein